MSSLGKAAQQSQWNRQELYEKVWQVPLRKLATEYGVSDVALAKTCRKLQIPLPGRGHWTKIECGHRIPRPALPKVEGLPVILRQIPKPKVPVLPEDLPELARLELIAQGKTPPVTATMLAHPLVEKTKKALTGASTNNRGALWHGRHAEVDWLDLRVSKDTLSRALRMMAALLYMLDREGFHVVVEKRRAESTGAIVCGETIRFGVVERSRQVKSAPASTSAGYSYDSIKLEPTGRLSIEVWNYYSGGPQKVWHDRDRMRLEEQLPLCIAGMMRIALKQRAERKAREKEELAKQRRINKVAKILRQIEDEEKKIKALESKAAEWQRAQRIREYIAAVREKAATEIDLAQAAKLQEWIEWAERQADRIDPLKVSPPSIVDDKEKVARRLQSSTKWS